MSLEKIPYKGKVYNFQVEDDESYTANNIIVHNCRCTVIASVSELLAGTDNAEDADED